MKPVLLIDLGSTYTKVTAVDVEKAVLLGTAQSYSTVATDIGEGLSDALKKLEEKTGYLEYEKKLACSSAAGGLRMITSGLVPELTAEAARLACLGAGAKVIKVFSYELTHEDINEIERLSPDILLLTGGVDGGNSKTILHNAEMLSACKKSFPILIAGNRSASARCEEILAKHEVYRCENVMPRLDCLKIGPVQEQIRNLFLNKIIQAKGLTKASALLDNILMPTPSAVMDAMKLLAKGTKNQKGIGDLLGVDLGGATTDVYSMANGSPLNDSTILKGLPEPYAKRTVEGDIGMRYSAGGILDAVGSQWLAEHSGLTPERVTTLTAFISSQTDSLPDRDELSSLDHALACGAIETAVRRHAGTIKQVYTPTGPAFLQTGKDLTEVSKVIVTGGAIIHNKRAAEIASFALYNKNDFESLRPKSAEIFVDRSYILAAMGLLSEQYPDAALTIIKKELEENGTHK